jgi:hypothetical protein
MNREPASFWGEVLSQNPRKINHAMRSLSERERRAVIEHLQRMAVEKGWSEGQRIGAKTALDLLGE